MLNFQLTGFQSRYIEDVRDQPFDGDSALMDVRNILILILDQGRITEKFGKPNDRVDRSAHFMTHRREKFTFGAIGGFGSFFGFDQRGFGCFPITDVVADRLIF